MRKPLTLGVPWRDTSSWKGMLSGGLLQGRSEDPEEGGLGNRTSDPLECRTRAGGCGCPKPGAQTQN